MMTQEERLLRTIKWAGIVGGAFGLACVYLLIDYWLLNFLTINLGHADFVRGMVLMGVPSMVAFLIGHFAERKFFMLEMSK